MAAFPAKSVASNLTVYIVPSTSVGGLARVPLCAPEVSSPPDSDCACGEVASAAPPVRVQVTVPALAASDSV